MREEKSKYIMRHNTEATWRTYNPILLSGEIGISEYTHEDNTVSFLHKIGDGVTPWNDLPFCQPRTDTTLTLPHVAADAAAVGARLQYIDGELQTLKQTCIEITSFNISPKYAEAGTTLGRVLLSWTYDNYSTIVSQSINGVDLNPNIRSLTLEGEFTQSTTFNLVVTDGFENTKTMQVKLEVLMPVFYGVSAPPQTYTEGFVYGLVKVLPTKEELEFTTSSGTSEYIYFAAPEAYGTCTFFHRGFEGGVQLVDTITLHLNETYTEIYNIYRSDYPNLGNTRLRVVFSAGPQTDLTISQTLPAGGAEGQVLMKASNQDYDTYWATLPREVPLGGATGQVLAKRSDASGDLEWKDFEGALPDVTVRDNGKILKVINGYWLVGDETTELPPTFPEDNGKILKEVDGYWVAATDPNDGSVVYIIYNQTTFDDALAALSGIGATYSKSIAVYFRKDEENFVASSIKIVSNKISFTITTLNDGYVYIGKVVIEKNELGETTYTLTNEANGVPIYDDIFTTPMLGLDSYGLPQWKEAPIGLPSVTDSDNGKVPMVDDGEWTKENPPWAKTFFDEGAPTPSISASVGDLYRDTLTNQLYQYTSNNTWVELCPQTREVPEPSISDNGKVISVEEGEYALTEPEVYENILNTNPPTASLEASEGEIYIDTLTGESYVCTSYVPFSSITSLESLNYTFNELLNFPETPEGATYPYTLFEYDAAFSYESNQISRDGLRIKGVVDETTIETEEYNEQTEQYETVEEIVETHQLIYVYDDNGVETEEIVYDSANIYAESPTLMWAYQDARTVTFGSTGTDLENETYIAWLLSTGIFSGYGSTWLHLSTERKLPEVTQLDNGKILYVQDGQWVLVPLSSLLGGN